MKETTTACYCHTKVFFFLTLSVKVVFEIWCPKINSGQIRNMNQIRLVIPKNRGRASTFISQKERKSPVWRFKWGLMHEIHVTDSLRKSGLSVVRWETAMFNSPWHEFISICFCLNHQGQASINQLWPLLEKKKEQGSPVKYYYTNPTSLSTLKLIISFNIYLDIRNINWNIKGFDAGPLHFSAHISVCSLSYKIAIIKAPQSKSQVSSCSPCVVGSQALIISQFINTLNVDSITATKGKVFFKPYSLCLWFASIHFIANYIIIPKEGPLSFLPMSPSRHRDGSVAMYSEGLYL